MTGVKVFGDVKECFRVLTKAKDAKAKREEEEVTLAKHAM